MKLPRFKNLLRTPTPARQLDTMAVKYFTGAQNSRFTSDWDAPDIPINDLLNGSYGTIRGRARWLENNDPYARRYLSAVDKNVIGPYGLIFRSLAARPDGSADKQDRQVVNFHHKQWSKLGNITVCGQHSRQSLERIIARRLEVDGEIFLRVHPGFNNKYRFALEIIPSESVDHTRNIPKSGNHNAVRMGVEVNKYNRPVAYWIHKDQRNYLNSHQSERIPADNIIHLFDRERPMQTRGISKFLAPMIRVRMLNAIEDAALIGTRVAANKMGFLLGEEEPTGDGTAENGAQYLNAAPGEIEFAGKYTKFETFDPGYPMPNLEKFIDSQLRGFAAGLDISHPTLANNLERVNLSSARHGEIHDREHWKMFHRFLIDRYADPIAEQFITLGITSGAIPLPITRLDKFLAFEHKGRRWASVDQLKSEQGRTQSMINGTLLSDLLEDADTSIEEYAEKRRYEGEVLSNAGLEPVDYARYENIPAAPEHENETPTPDEN